MAADQFRMQDTERQGPRLRITKIVIETAPDEFPDLSHLESEYDEETQTVTKSVCYSNADVRNQGWEKVKGWIDEDRRRLDSYGDAWVCVGVEAIAYLSVLLKGGLKGFAICQTIRSGGVWGIENDSETGYLREEGENELAQLRDILSALGVEQAEIGKAIAEAGWQE